MVAKNHRKLGRLYRDLRFGGMAIYLRDRGWSNNYDEFFNLITHSVMNIDWRNLETWKASSSKDLVHIPSRDEHRIIKKVFSGS